MNTDLRKAVDEYLAALPPHKRTWIWFRRNFVRPASDAIYWLKCHTMASHRFHLVDCRNKWYEYGWQDVDNRMLYACFNLLCDFVHAEQGLHDLVQRVDAHPVNSESGAEVRHVAKEVSELYDWWTSGREPHATDESYEKDTEMLSRLVKIRSVLWT